MKHLISVILTMALSQAGATESDKSKDPKQPASDTCKSAFESEPSSKQINPKLIKELRLKYTVWGQGWPALHLRTENKHLHATASYLRDALGDLADAALEIARGASKARCSFDEEPGEYRWIFRRNGEIIHIKVLWFGELWGNQPDREGKLLIQFSCDLQLFLTELHKMLKDVLKEYGLEHYQVKWGYAFPSKQMEQVKALLRDQSEDPL